jgi:large subunit ribosomal protein L14e
LQASPFRRFVQIGRVCVINFGRDAGKLCVIIDVINQNRALIDGPYTVTGVKRQAIPFKRLSLTDYVVTIPRNARQKLLTKAMKDADIMSKWKKSRWYKKNAAARLRARMTDFERFKVTLAKKRVRIFSCISSLGFFVCVYIDIYENVRTKGPLLLKQRVLGADGEALLLFFFGRVEAVLMQSSRTDVQKRFALLSFRLTRQKLKILYFCFFVRSEDSNASVCIFLILVWRYSVSITSEMNHASNNSSLNLPVFLFLSALCSF